jgi:hypothetical protein
LEICPLQVVFRAHDGAVLAMQLFQVTTDAGDPGPMRLITSGAPLPATTCLLSALPFCAIPGCCTPCAACSLA